MFVKQFCTHVVYTPSHDRTSAAQNSPIIPPETKLRPLAEPHNSTPALVRNRARMLIEFLRFLICQDLCRTLLLLRIFCFCACRHPSPSASERKGQLTNKTHEEKTLPRPRCNSSRTLPDRLRKQDRSRHTERWWCRCSDWRCRSAG